MKFFTRFSVFIFLTFSTVHTASAQSTADSLALLKANWQFVTLDKGLQWKSLATNILFSSRQNINIIEFSPKNKNYTMSFVPSETSTVSSLAKKNSALIAVNGASKGEYLKINKNRIDTQQVDSSFNGGGNGMITLSPGKVKVIKLNKGFSPEGFNYPSIMVSGPMLLNEGLYESLDSTDVNITRQAQTAIGEMWDGRVILVTVDGGHAKAQGMNNFELSWLMFQMGCKSAVALTGGAETTMYVRGEMDNGVVNYPSSNAKYDHYGEQPVASIIMIATKK